MCMVWAATDGCPLLRCVPTTSTTMAITARMTHGSHRHGAGARRGFGPDDLVTGCRPTPWR